MKTLRWTWELAKWNISWNSSCSYLKFSLSYSVIFTLSHIIVNSKFFFFNLQITFFIGMVFNELINTVLKYIIKQPRPISRDNNYNEYGMPSSHSQFVWFFSIYMFLFIWIRLQHITNTKSVWFSKTIVSLGCFAAALIVTVSRYIPPAFFFLFWWFKDIEFSFQNIFTVPHCQPGCCWCPHWITFGLALVLTNQLCFYSMVSNSGFMVNYDFSALKFTEFKSWFSTGGYVNGYSFETKHWFLMWCGLNILSGGRKYVPEVVS